MEKSQYSKSNKDESKVIKYEVALNQRVLTIRLIFNIESRVTLLTLPTHMTYLQPFFFLFILLIFLFKDMHTIS